VTVLVQASEFTVEASAVGWRPVGTAEPSVPVPAGQVHAVAPGALQTMCGEPVAGLYVWDMLWLAGTSVPCPRCVVASNEWRHAGDVPDGFAS
jgi:hypothetical protein